MKQSCTYSKIEEKYNCPEFLQVDQLEQMETVYSSIYIWGYFIYQDKYEICTDKSLA